MKVKVSPSLHYTTTYITTRNKIRFSHQLPHTVISSLNIFSYYPCLTKQEEVALSLFLSLEDRGTLLKDDYKRQKRRKRLEWVIVALVLPRRVLEERLYHLSS